MKDKLEVGMYVRYISSFQNNDSYKPVMFIGKILELDDYYIKLDTFRGGVYGIKDFINLIIGKPSFNPIDLIEVGDYVNGYYVSKIWFENELTHYIDDKPIKRKERQITIQAPSYGGIVHLKNEEIKSIVTKEQFESMSYKLGD